MACSGRHPWQGKKELGAVIVDIDLGGGGSKGVGIFLSGVAGCVAIWGRDVGAYT